MLAAIVLSMLPGLQPAARADYPERAVKLICPYPPGGGADAVARVVSAALTASTGQPFVVENHAGASGRIGTELAARAAPDGYTLLLGSVGPNAIIPAAYKSLPYDARKSFAPVSVIGTSAYALVVPASVPARNVNELIALAKAQPGKLNFASTGNLGGPHLAGELFKLLSGTNVEHVAYKGGGPMIAALLANEVTFAFVSLPTVAPHVKAGTLRVLAVTGSKPASTMPDVPTMGEFLKGYEVLQWYGILAPANTPAAIVARLNAEIVKVVNSPKTRESLARIDAEPATTTPEAFSAQIARELDQYRDLVEKAGIRADE
jgi:tripartite-type tricarboxylate transporter receptor subunit TctC